MKEKKKKKKEEEDGRGKVMVEGREVGKLGRSGGEGEE